MKINIEEIDAIREKILEINRAELKTLELYKDGKRIEVPVEAFDWFQYTGLNNWYFITMEVYCNPFGTENSVSEPNAELFVRRKRKCFRRIKRK